MVVAARPRPASSAMPTREECFLIPISVAGRDGRSHVAGHPTRAAATPSLEVSTNLGQTTGSPRGDRDTRGGVTGGGHLVAIDFGSTNTVAVLRSPGGRRRVLLFDGSPLLPSAVYAAPSGELLVGRDAAHMARDDPARYEPYPKRRVDDGSVLLGGRGIPVVELVAAVLRRVADEARRTAGTLPPAVLTHPVAWGSARRGVLVEAARRAGLTVLDLVAEPIAAAAYFTTVLGTELPAGACLAVFDLGGGTFDVAVVRGSGGARDLSVVGTGGGGAGDLSVVGTGGLDDVGGLDLDAA